MTDLNAFVSDFIRQKGLGEHAQAGILEEVQSRLDDMILGKLDSGSALDEYEFLREFDEESELRAFLESAIPDLDRQEQQLLDNFRSTYTP